MPLFAPVIKAFKRLRATDGLLITADSWQRTQDYHRERQNFYYQSLHQAGIVTGLGVTVIPAPAEVEARYRNQRWVQVQPGIAIDAQGNPIVVTEASSFQVQSTCAPDEHKTIYLVLNYVDPTQLRSQPGQDWVQETFRIVEKGFLDVLDVELCRIQLTAGTPDLANPTEVLAPGLNTLDLRHRRAIAPRPTGLVKVAYLEDPHTPNGAIAAGFAYLLQSLTVLYPTLSGEPMPPPISLQAMGGQDLQHCDLVYLAHRHLAAVSLPVQTQLQQFLQGGGTLLIGADEVSPRQVELLTIRRELVDSLADAETDASVAAIVATVQAEIAAIDGELAQGTAALRQTVGQFASQLGWPLGGTGELSADHPLKTTPFLFARLPEVDELPVQLWGWGGVLLLGGNLASAWAPDAAGQRSRDTIRTAHELGINLLHYAWRRRHLTQCQQLATPLAATPATLSLTSQVSS